MYLQDKIHDKSNMYRLALTDDEAKLEDMGRLVHAEVRQDDPIERKYTRVPGLSRGKPLNQETGRGELLPIFCHVCIRPFTSNQTVNVTYVHLTPKPHSCIMCNKRYKIMSELTQQTLRMHVKADEEKK